jgi:asparagine synthase (glutamine-hydrolysing)
MCGIVGLVGRHDPGLLAPMNALLRHRGPDDEGWLSDPGGGVSLAMRRLSILDLDHGHQPMRNEDGTVWVVFNGEIYNSPELRLGLEARGHRFLTKNSDTEVLVHLWEEQGEALLGELNGMYAFVLYDARRKRLFGARDPAGIKPLYYWQAPNRFAFASELKSLLLVPGVTREIDFASLDHYLTLLYVPGERSIVRGVRRLPPAHCFTYDVATGELAVRRYWQPDFTPRPGRSVAEWAEALRDQLRRSLRRWVLADVPVGCSLSGGIDSASLVGILAETGYRPLRTYSLGFAGPGEAPWDELTLARQVAERWGTEHHEVVLEPEALLGALVEMVWSLDEPYGGGLPSWYVFREMRRHVKVALTGTGGDELFGNYGKFRVYETHPAARQGLAWRRAARRWPAAARAAEGALRLAARGPLRPRLLARHGRLTRPFGEFYYAGRLYFADAVKPELLQAAAGREAGATGAYLQALFDAAPTGDVRNGVLAVDFGTQLAEEFLLMTDRFSMAHSLEARTPYLDRELVDVVLSIPPDVRTAPGDLKYLFKRAVADLLPGAVLAGPKRGFVIPIEPWLRGRLRPLAERLLAPERLARQGIFRPELYHRYVAPHVRGEASCTWQVWAALMFQLWHVVFVEERATAVPAFGWADLCR